MRIIHRIREAFAKRETVTLRYEDMTPEQQAAFDHTFEKMRETMKAMGSAFATIRGKK